MKLNIRVTIAIVLIVIATILIVNLITLDPIQRHGGIIVRINQPINVLQLEVLDIDFTVGTIQENGKAKGIVITASIKPDEREQFFTALENALPLSREELQANGTILQPSYSQSFMTKLYIVITILLIGAFALLIPRKKR